MTKTSKKNNSETFALNGKELLQKVKQLIHEGNVRRLSIIDKNGKTVLIIPLTVGVVGAVLAPPLAAIGAVAALLTECTLKVERQV